MKKSLPAIFALFLTCSLNAQVFSSSFESWTNTDPDNWMGSATNIAGDSVNQVTGQSTYGNSAVELRNPSTTHKRFTTMSMALTAGQAYTITYWVKGSGLIRAGLYNGVSGSNGSQFMYSLYDTLVNVSTWTQYSKTVTADSANGQFMLSVKSTAASTHLLVDSFAVTTSSGGTSSANIYQIQYSTSAPFNSPLNNQFVNTGGLISAINMNGSSKGYWLQSGTGPWTGVFVLDSTNASTSAIGDSVTFKGMVYEYFGLTELKTISNFVKVSSGNTVPVTSISTATANTEDYESVLVKVNNALCTNPNSGFGQWKLFDGTDTTFVDDLLYAYTPALNSYYNVTGVQYYSFSEWKIEPRMASDISVATGIKENNSKNNLSVYPNPSNGTIYLSAVTAGSVVEVMDLTGKVLLAEKVVQSGNVILDLKKAGASAGTYFVRVKNSENIKTAKFIVAD
jgi:hypothetical protein